MAGNTFNRYSLHQDESGGHLSEADYGLTTPVAPEGGRPAVTPADEEHLPETPIAPEDSRPVSPAWPVFPIFPSCPSCPSSQTYGRVRFLNASANSFTVNISIYGTNYTINSRFGTVSDYDWISDGFHTVTVRRASGLRTILLQQTFPFSAGQRYTMVLTDTSSGGLRMTQVPASGCSSLGYSTGCCRTANMSYSGSSFSVYLYSHDAVFQNVDFQEVTPYKQAAAGTYQFYVANAGISGTPRELPVLVPTASGTSAAGNEPLVSYQVDIAAGRLYTSYIIGNTWSDASFRVITLED